MVSIGETISDITPNLPSFGGILGIISILVYGIIVAIVAGIAAYYFFIWSKYNRKIVIFEDLAGQGYVPTGRDKAKLILIGDAGEQLLYLKKRKLYRTAYGKKIGKNTYAFAIGKDGYWYNFTFGSLDTSLNVLGIAPVDRDMRYMHVAIRRNIKERYDRKNWLKENFGMLIGFAVVIIIVIFLWLIIREYIGSLGAITDILKGLKEVVDAQEQVLRSLDNILSSGGLRPV